MKISDFKPGQIIEVEEVRVRGGFFQEGNKAKNKVVERVEPNGLYLKGSKCRHIIDGHIESFIQAVTSVGWGKRYRVISK